MSLIAPEDNLLLLNVFGNGLKLDLVSKNQVVQWADSVISRDDDPDYFFIELSLAKNANELLSIINNRIVLSLDENSCRVLLGLLSHMFSNELTDIQKAVSIIDKINMEACLSSMEQESLWNVYYEFDRRFELIDNTDAELREIITKALIHYHDFTIYNVEDWPDINLSIDEYWSDIDIQRLIDIECQHSAEKRNREKQALRIRIFMALIMLAAILFVSVNYTDFVNRTMVGKFKRDLYQICLILCIFLPYVIFRIFVPRKRNT
ncbi:hypothetical protein [Mucilaginibacter lappiensis]|uniref:Uncharacterized protein n=1 Tax=Mucilaginibacter lappiensis TaxID=354630 RepID=A0A841JEY7_9SPHI|nr:hypothetical protein [Mucilaginibacter lappiensis]MBB6129723.1 hypothetical protein [Mucilaginibacter lappiensis]